MLVSGRVENHLSYCSGLRQFTRAPGKWASVTPCPLFLSGSEDITTCIYSLSSVLTCIRGRGTNSTNIPRSSLAYGLHISFQCLIFCLHHKPLPNCSPGCLWGETKGSMDVAPIPVILFVHFFSHLNGMHLMREGLALSERQIKYVNMFLSSSLLLLVSPQGLGNVHTFSNSTHLTFPTSNSNIYLFQ